MYYLLFKDRDRYRNQWAHQNGLWNGKKKTSRNAQWLEALGTSLETGMKIEVFYRQLSQL